MRRILLAGVAGLAVLGGAALAYHYLHHGNLLQDARQRLARGDVYGAELDLDSFLRQHPGDGEASFRLGLIDLAESKPVAAERNFRKAKAASYDAVALILPTGEAYLRQRHFDELLNDFTVEGAPKGGEAMVLALRANAYLGLGKMAEAQQAAQEGIRAAPDSPDALLVASRVDLASGDIKGARDMLDRALAKDPKRPESLLLKAELAMHADPATQRSDPQAALGLARQVLTDHPHRLDAQMAEARALAAQHKDVEAAKVVDGVLKAAPKDIGANYLRVVLAVRQRDFATADAALQLIYPVIDDLPQGDYFLAVTKLGLNQPAQAQEAATKYAARYPDDPAGQKLLAFSELALHRPDRAMAILKQLEAKGVTPDADMLDLLARAQGMTGDIKGAEQNLAQAAVLAPQNIEVLNRLAATKLGLGDIEAGKAELKKSLDTSPDQPVAATTLVATALAQGDLDEAQAIIDKLRKAMGNTELVGVLDAQSKVAHMDLAGAKALYEDVLKRFPGSREATFGLVQVEGRLGDTRTAQERLNGWMAVHPTDLQGLRLQVKALMSEGDRKGAIAAAEAAHAGNPSDLEITAILAELYIGNQQASQAIDLIDRSQGSSAGQLAVLRGEALIQANKLQDADTVLRAAIAANPKDPRASLALMQLQMKQNDLAGARTTMEGALAANPGSLPLMEARVAIDLKTGGIKQALATAKQLQSDPANMPLAVLLPGGALEAAGDSKGAADAFAAAYRQAPSKQTALAAGVALLKAGRAPEARALLEGWAAQHPDDAAPLEVLATMALTAHRLDDARTLLTHILQVLPNNAASLNNLAWVKLQQGDAAGATADAMRAFYLQPGPESEDTLGWALVKTGKASQAMPLLEQAAAARPTDAIMYHYAAVLHAAGRSTEAKAAVDKALADGKPFDERADALALQAKVTP